MRLRSILIHSHYITHITPTPPSPSCLHSLNSPPLPSLPSPPPSLSSLPSPFPLFPPLTFPFFPPLPSPSLSSLPSPSLSSLPHPCSRQSLLCPAHSLPLESRLPDRGPISSHDHHHPLECSPVSCPYGSTEGYQAVTHAVTQCIHSRNPRHYHEQLPPHSPTPHNTAPPLTIQPHPSPVCHPSLVQVLQPEG